MFRRFFHKEVVCHLFSEVRQSSFPILCPFIVTNPFCSAHRSKRKTNELCSPKLTIATAQQVHNILSFDMYGPYLLYCQLSRTGLLQDWGCLHLDLPERFHYHSCLQDIRKKAMQLKSRIAECENVFVLRESEPQVKSSLQLQWSYHRYSRSDCVRSMILLELLHHQQTNHSLPISMSHVYSMKSSSMLSTSNRIISDIQVSKGLESTSKTESDANAVSNPLKNCEAIIQGAGLPQVIMNIPNSTPGLQFWLSRIITSVRVEQQARKKESPTTSIDWAQELTNILALLLLQALVFQQSVAHLCEERRASLPKHSASSPSKRADVPTVDEVHDEADLHAPHPGHHNLV